MKTQNIFALLFLLAALSGCASESKKDISDAHLQFGLRAVEIVDSYLNFELSGQAAYDQLGILLEQKDSLPKTDEGDPTHTNDFLVETDVLLIQNKILQFYGFDKGSYNDILADRDDLARIIGEPTKK